MDNKVRLSTRNIFGYYYRAFLNVRRRPDALGRLTTIRSDYFRYSHIHGECFRTIQSLYGCKLKGILYRWWTGKIAAGFTNSASRSGGKLKTLIQLAVFAAQHSRHWVNMR
jgi:NAD(P)H dehydrogenase (quinone)